VALLNDLVDFVLERSRTMNTQESLRKTSIATSAALVAAAAVFAAAQSQALAGDKTSRDVLAFASSRDHPSTDLNLVIPGVEVYVWDINPDGSFASSIPQRLTDNSFFDTPDGLSPDGQKLVFESDRLRASPEPLFTSDLFVMEVAGALHGALGGEAWLARGTAATWSPDSKYIAYHFSESGEGNPINGEAWDDSDIFVLNVEDALAGVAEPINLANNMGTEFMGEGTPGSGRGVDSDADWSHGPVCYPGHGCAEKIVFTSHDYNDLDPSFNPNCATYDPTTCTNWRPSADIYVMNTDGTDLVQLTNNRPEEERAPAWSPDNSKIAYMCRKTSGLLPNPPTLPDLEICVMNADGSNQLQLTDNKVTDASPTWSPDGKQIFFNRNPAFQIFMVKADGTAYPDGKHEHQITSQDPPGNFNVDPKPGVIRAHN
jgi:Tol biopolymer transport system component